MGVSAGRGATGYQRLQKMEDAFSIVKNKEGVLGAVSKKKGQGSSGGTMLKGNF